MQAVDQSGRWEQIQLLFDELIELDPEAQARRLSELHSEDPTRCAAVVSLLKAFDVAGDFMGLLSDSDPGEGRRLPFAPAPLQAGAMIQAYRIIRELGRGGMGAVYLAHDQRLGRLVALKFVSPHLSTSAEARERLYAEARAAAALDHPNVATVFEIGEDEAGGVFIAMAYYAGRTLKERIAQGALPLDEALDVAEQVAAGLAAAHHKGIIHRDVKPANIALPERGPVKILDFGLAKRSGQDLTQGTRAMGTVAYMSPEQIRGEAVDHRTDLWSLGAVLYEMLSGQQPFRGEHEASLLHAILHYDPAPLRALQADFPADVEEVVRKALAKHPEARYQDADALLQDLQRLLQRVLPSRPAPFPPLRTHGSWPANLPAPLTELIGRERELQQLKHLLWEKGGRLLTLTGSGGTGKTRLAVHLAADLAAAFEDGVCFVSLAPIADPALVASAVARTLGVRELGSASIRESLLAFLQDKHKLLVLDNFEHVVEAAAFVAELLAACPLLTFLVTSRAPLHLQGELEFPVPPLAVPPASDLPPEQMLRCASVALFVARAQAVQPGFTLNAEHAAAVGEICTRLDGLPLAIELAAARVKVLSPRALVTRLQHRFDLLEAEGRDRPVRHRTLREAVAWSYELLTASEQTCFRRLGVFAGGCSLEAAEAVCGEDGATAPNVLGILASLVDKSLIRQEEDPDGEPRFTLLKTIREYALDWLRESGAETDTSRLHLNFFLQFAEEAAPQLTGPDQVAWFDRLEREHNNLRAALTFALSDQGDAAARLTIALCRFWLARGFVGEGYERATTTLAASGDDLAPGYRAHLLIGTALLAANGGLFATAREMLSEALALLRVLANPVLTGEALNHLSWNLLCMGDHAPAAKHAEEALALYRSLDHARGVGVACNNLGYCSFLQGDYGTSAAYFEESVAYGRGAGDLRSLSRSLSNLGYALHYQGHLEKAEALHEQAVAISDATRDLPGRLISNNRLILTRYELGKAGPAAALLTETLPLFRAAGHIWGLLECLNIAAYVLLQSGELAQAHSVDGELLQYAQRVGCKPAVALVLCRRGELRLQAGDVDGAEEAFRESLRLRREMAEKAGTAECLEGLARVALDQHQGARAAVLLGAAEAIREAAQAAVLPRRAPGRQAFIQHLRTAVGEETFSPALQEGRQMNLRDAAVYGLQEHRER